MEGPVTMGRGFARAQERAAQAHALLGLVKLRLGGGPIYGIRGYSGRTRRNAAPAWACGAAWWWSCRWPWLPAGLAMLPRPRRARGKREPPRTSPGRRMRRPG